MESPSPRAVPASDVTPGLRHQHGVHVPALQRKLVKLGSVDHFRYGRFQRSLRPFCASNDPVFVLSTSGP